MYVELYDSHSTKVQFFKVNNTHQACVDAIKLARFQENRSMPHVSCYYMQTLVRILRAIADVTGCCPEAASQFRVLGLRVNAAFNVQNAACF